MNGVFVVCAFLVFSVTHGQYLPQGILGVPASSTSCKYEFTVPDTKGACSMTSAGLDKKVDQVRDDIVKTRMQYVAQNSIVQSTLAKVQSDTATYVSRVHDLTNQFQKLRQSINLAPSGANPNPGNAQNVNQILQDTKDLLSKAVQDINNKIFNLTYQFQRSAVEQSKVDTAIEKQINQQAVQIATTEQRVINLETQIKSLQGQTSTFPVGTPTSGGAPSNAQLTNLSQQFQKLQQDVQQHDQSQQVELASLNTKANQALQQVLNQSLEISSIRTATTGAMARVLQAEANLTVVKDDLDHLKKNIEPKIKAVSDTVAELRINVTRTELDLQQLGSILMNNRLNATLDHVKIQSIANKANLLASQLTNLENEVTHQSTDLLKMTNDLHALTSVPSLSGNGTLTSAALQQAVQLFQAQVAQSLNATNADIAQLQKVVPVLVQQITSLLQSRPPPG